MQRNLMYTTSLIYTQRVTTIAMTITETMSKASFNEHPERGDRFFDR